MANENNVPYAEFGEKLTALRKERKMTRQQLGDLCGIAPSTILNYEKGTRIPYADTAIKMAQVFGIPVEELLCVENPEAEMEKAKTIDSMGRIFGKRSADSAQAYLDGTNALLAGGTLAPEEQLDFITIMRKVLVDAEIKAKERYTPHKFRTPEWKEKTADMRSAANDVMSEADSEMSGRASQRYEDDGDDE